MKINEYIKNNRDEQYNWLTKRLVCHDGFSISVQAGEHAYCGPRRNDADYYYLLECGFPSEVPDLIMSYAETPSEPLQTVFGYVPVDLVQELLDSHGGIKGAFREAG